MTYYLIANLMLWGVATIGVARWPAGHVTTYTEGEIRVRLGIRLVMAVWTALLLTGCGGGDPEPEPDFGEMPCKYRPDCTVGPPLSQPPADQRTSAPTTPCQQTTEECK